jgi:hypothetical protein
VEEAAKALGKLQGEPQMFCSNCAFTLQRDAAECLFKRGAGGTTHGICDDCEAAMIDEETPDSGLRCVDCGRYGHDFCDGTRTALRLEFLEVESGAA